MPNQDINTSNLTVSGPGAQDWDGNAVLSSFIATDGGPQIALAGSEARERYTVISAYADGTFIIETDKSGSEGWLRWNTDGYWEGSPFRADVTGRFFGELSAGDTVFGANVITAPNGGFTLDMNQNGAFWVNGDLNVQGSISTEGTPGLTQDVAIPGVGTLSFTKGLLTGFAPV